MKKRRGEKGSVTLYVLVSMTFFLVVVMGIYISSSNKLRAQEGQIKRVQQQYNNIEPSTLYTDITGNMVAPTITATLNNASGPIYTPGTWTNQYVYIILSSTDHGSGIKEYQWNNGTWTTDEFTFNSADSTSSGIFTNDMNQDVSFRTVYKAGNVSKTSSILLKIDRTPPTTPIITAKINDVNGATYTSGTWTNKPVYITLASTDSGSGIKEYQWYDNSWKTSEFTLNSTDKTSSAIFEKDINQTVKFKSVDNAMNESSESSIVLKIDQTAPTTAKPTLTSTTNSITVTNNQKDALSGIKTVQYQIKKNSDSTWGNLQTSNVFKGLIQTLKYDVRTYTTDNAGNSSYSAVESILTKTVPGSITFEVTPSPILVKNAVGSNLLKIGDTISYTPLSDLSYTVKQNDSGHSADQTFTSSNSSMTTWKVWDIDTTNKTIQLVSADNTSTTLTLGGANGDNNGVQILNDLCSYLYSDSSKGITARSMDAKDIEDAIVQNGQVLETAIKSAVHPNYGGGTTNIAYGTVCTMETQSTSNRITPNRYTQNDITSQQNNDLRPGTESYVSGYTDRNSLTVKNSWYDLSTSNLQSCIGTTRQSILGTRSCWLASRDIDADTGHASFDMRMIASGDFRSFVMFVSGGTTWGTELGLCPTISLSPTTQLIKENGVWKVMDGNSGWVNQDVSVKALTTETSFTLQTSKDGKTYGTTNPLTYTENGTAYARLWDGNNAGKVASLQISNIDKVAPTTTAPTLASTTNSITVTNNQTDALSGVKMVQYQIKKNSDTTWGSLQTSNVFIGLTQNLKYDVRTRSTDNAGNSSDSVVSSITTKTLPSVTLTANPTSWTNGNVTVNATANSTISGAVMQMKAGSGNWSNTTSLTVSSNQTVYARLTDNINNGATATIAIANIDKIAPTNNTPNATATVNSITLKLNQTDSGGSGINTSKTQYRMVSDANASSQVRGWQTSNVFSGLSQNTIYYFQSQVTDNAGNTTTSAVKSALTAITYNYVGYIQSYRAPLSGTYRLEVWGACGGSWGGGINQPGGYSYGNYYMSAGQTIYICNGGGGSEATTGHTMGAGSHTGYNGGGINSEYWFGEVGGGGATSITTVNRGELRNFASYQGEVLLVAGGAGCNGYNGDAGVGGGLVGGNAGNGLNSSWNAGGTQTGTGTGEFPGGFGYGGNSKLQGGPGGGGWYGGSGGSPAGYNYSVKYHPLINGNVAYDVTRDAYSGGGGGSGHCSSALSNSGTEFGTSSNSPNGGSVYINDGMTRITKVDQ